MSRCNLQPQKPNGKKSSVRGVVFFGTPHAGSDFAAIADAAARLVRLILVKQPNSYILDVLNRNSAMLANIENDSSKLVLRRIKELQQTIRLFAFRGRVASRWLRASK